MKKSPLKQTTGPGSKPKDSTNIEKTTDYSRNQKSIAAGISNNKGKFGGTTKNPKTGVQESDAYVPKYVKGKGNTADQVVSNGKVIRKSVTAEMKEKTNPAYYNYRSGKPQTKKIYILDIRRTVLLLWVAAINPLIMLILELVQNKILQKQIKKNSLVKD